MVLSVDISTTITRKRDEKTRASNWCLRFIVSIIYISS